MRVLTEDFLIPYYLYEHPTTGVVKEVFQGMNDDHVFFEDGHMWKRLWVKPAATIDSTLDAYSSKDFLRYTSNRKGTYGNVTDLAAELSEKRAAKEGKDPIKERWYDQYAAQRKGKEHINRAQESVKAKLASKGFEVEF